MDNAITTTHKLDFEAGGYLGEFIRYRVGTCTGLYNTERDCFAILAIINHEPGNGHLEDVFEWFEHACRRDKKCLRILEVWNERFGKHLIEKRGFTYIPHHNIYEKSFN